MQDARQLDHARLYLNSLNSLREAGIEEGWLYFLLGRFWSLLNELDEAEAAYSAVVCKFDPGHVETWSNLSSVLRRKGELDGAARCANHAVVLDPNHGPAYANLANVQFLRGHLDEALAAASVAWQRFRLPSGLDIMGRIYLGSERYREAEACYVEFLTLVPNGPTADQARSFLSLARSHGASTG